MKSDLKRAAKRPPGRNGYVYKAQFGVIVLCADEAEQRANFGRLQAMGLRLKVVTV